MTAAVQEALPPCPRCGGKVWDNRIGKKNPKAPDFKCRDKSCQGVIWPPKNTTWAGKPSAQTLAANPAPTKGRTGPDTPESEDATFAELQRGEAWVELRARYMESVSFVLKHVVPEIEKVNKDIGVSPESFASMVATVFIQRMQKGV